MIICRNIETHKTVTFPNVKAVLEEINRDRSEDWTPYTKHDWKEGLEEFTEYRLLNVLKSKSVIPTYYQITRKRKASGKKGAWSYRQVKTNGKLKDESVCYTCYKLRDIEDYFREAEQDGWDIEGYIFELVAQKQPSVIKASSKGLKLSIDGKLLGRQIKAVLESNMPEPEKAGLHHLLGAIMDCYVDDIKGVEVAFKGK